VAAADWLPGDVDGAEGKYVTSGIFLVNCFDAAVLCSLATVDFAAVADTVVVSVVNDLVEG